MSTGSSSGGGGPGKMKTQAGAIFPMIMVEKLDTLANSLFDSLSLSDSLPSVPLSPYSK